MRRIATAVAVLAVQPLAVLAPTMSDALAAAPHPVAPVVARIGLTGIDYPALGVERSAGRGLTLGTAAVPAPDAGLRLAALSGPRTGQRFSVAGVTWTGPTPVGTTVAIRVHENGRWGDWSPAPVADDGPDPGTAEAAAGGGTDPVLTSGSADGVQVKVLTESGVAPAGLAVALVDPGTSDADGTVGTTATASAQASGARPVVLSRAHWGADERLRKGDPSYLPVARAGFLHHTAGANNYSARAVPANIRGIYAYHTKVRGWNDIAYNVLVDRFGRIWEGRAGGVALNVRGAHALGFNAETFGVSAMGNYETAQPSSAMLTAIAKVFAWKFSLNRVDPRGRVTLTSEGNLRHRAGARVTLPTMAAHRDVGPTACPGKNLYRRMDALRSAVVTRVGAEILRPEVSPGTVIDAATNSVDVRARLTGTQRWQVSVTSGCARRPLWTRTGTGSSVDRTWWRTDSAVRKVPPGTYLVTVTAHSKNSTSTPYSRRVEVLPRLQSPLGPCPAYRLAAGNAGSVADGVRRTAGRADTLVVVPSEHGHRTESVFAGALAAAYGGRLVSSPSTRLTADVVARIRRDQVTRVVLVGRDGTWGADVGTQVTDLGATPVTIAGPTADAVLAATGRRTAELLAAGGSVTTAMLVDPADPVTAASAAAVAGRLGYPVLPARASGVPASTATALTDLGITDLLLAGTGGVDAAAVTALRAVYQGVVDRRGPNRDAALVAAADLVPLRARTTAVVVPGTGTDGLEAVLASGLARPMLLLRSGALAPAAKGWFSKNATKVTRVAVAATPAQASADFLAGANGLVRTAAAVAAAPTVTVPSSFTVKGSGFGHGVGMSQYGAYAMARSGAGSAQILRTYYPGTKLSQVSDGRTIRVNLLHRTGRVTFEVGRATRETGAVRMRMSAGRSAVTAGPDQPLTAVPAAGGGIEVRRGGTRVLVSDGPIRLRWTGTAAWAGRRAVVEVTGSGTGGAKAARPYRYGQLWVVRVGSRLEVVNEVALGTGYLRGIAEMPTSWGTKGPAALQAQSVAARTYAWSKLLRGPVDSCGGCHLYDSVRDQAFRGYTVELDSHGRYWSAAVAATRGRILRYRGAPAQTLYYSSSGGRTQDNRDVFGAPTPYLVSVADPQSLASGNPYAAWTRTVSQAGMRAAFGLPDVVSVTVVERTAGKAARTVRARSSTGATATLSGTRLRAALRLPANWVWGVTGTVS